MNLRVVPRAFFTLLILGILVGSILTSWNWPHQTRFLPWTIGIPAVILCLAQLVVDLWRARRADYREGPKRVMDLQVDYDLPFGEVMRRATSMWGWIFGFLAGTWLFGLIISTPLFVWSYLTFQGREKWWIALTTTCLVFAFALGVFHYLLHVPWIMGVIPWPQEVVLGWLGH